MGEDWVARWPEARAFPRNGHDPQSYLRSMNEALLRDSAPFFDYAPPDRFEFDGENVAFPSPIQTPYPENNTMRMRYFPAASRRGPVRKAVIVLPHWNSSSGQHVALCRGLQKLGLSSVRISLPYHDDRMPPELQRADYAVSSNIGRTLDATARRVWTCALRLTGCRAGVMSSSASWAPVWEAAMRFWRARTTRASA